MEMKNDFQILTALGPWWEDVDVCGTSTSTITPSAGRNKERLFQELFDPLASDLFVNKTVIDFGSNAGGSVIAALSRGAKHVTALELNPKSFSQLNLVLGVSPHDAKKYTLLNESVCHSRAELADLFGQKEIGLCLGLIYHLQRNDVLELMAYMASRVERSFFSSTISHSDARPAVDWDVSKDGITALAKEAGFSRIEVIMEAKSSGQINWSWMTNVFYFEAVR